MPITKEVIVLYTDDEMGNSIGEIVGEVVRCKDCRYWSNNECIYCYFEDNPNGYCAWGERREDGHTER